MNFVQSKLFFDKKFDLSYVVFGNIQKWLGLFPFSSNKLNVKVIDGQAQ